MSPKLKRHQSLNVTKMDMSPKLIRHQNLLFRSQVRCIVYGGAKSTEQGVQCDKPLESYQISSTASISSVLLVLLSVPVCDCLSGVLKGSFHNTNIQSLHTVQMLDMYFHSTICPQIFLKYICLSIFHSNKILVKFTLY